MEHINEIGEHDSSLPESVERLNRRLSRSLSIDEAFNSSKKEFKGGISAECMVVTLPTFVDETLKEEDSVKEVKERAQEKSFKEKKMDGLGVHEAGIGHEGGVDRTLKAPPCAYVTQNSVNEDREKAEKSKLLNGIGSVVDLRQDPSVKKQIYRSLSKQASVCEDQKENKDDDLVDKRPHVAIEMEWCSKTLASEVSSTQTVTGSRLERRWRRVMWCMVVNAIITFLLSCAVIVLIISRPTSSEPLQVSEFVSAKFAMPDSQKPLQESFKNKPEHARPIGRFVLDQQVLKNEGSLRWKESEQTAGSSVKPSQNDSCVVVPEAGLYRVSSLITFKFNGLTDRSEVAHSVSVPTDTDEGTLQRQVIAVPYRDPALPKRQETMVPSFHLTTAKVKAHNRICIAVTPVNLVYKSNIDNALMVEKVE
ncbi:hypothetical protein MAR_013535 [Mya arenaria]|uniref:TNF family profile domain-containing protein n=1 Tax=Mya arenaria TaxID=6604 RepID=A0ABY7G469_MYAAR|nr:uncharacterized protein LOC128219033 [Mya arenaria]XP_052782806.1 uncharacterized protein LOC128219033 [Mya arenaria]WAR27831.1 hypothetical protein MAR_013535 [Mya arenaria]